MKFIADVMLGSLAKHLRLLGYDVLYDSTLNDNAIIRLALEQERVILTRDLPLTRRPLAANHMFVNDQILDLQIRQVVSAYPLPPKVLPLTRCSGCNGVLVRILRNEVKDLVPEHVYEEQRQFWRCPDCGKVYWKGSHVAAMRIEAGEEP